MINLFFNFSSNSGQYYASRFKCELSKRKLCTEEGNAILDQFGLIWPTNLEGEVRTVNLQVSPATLWERARRSEGEVIGMTGFSYFEGLLRMETDSILPVHSWANLGRCSIPVWRDVEISRPYFEDKAKTNKIELSIFSDYVSLASINTNLVKTNFIKNRLMGEPF